jgi:hypothetical protein
MKYRWLEVMTVFRIRVRVGVLDVVSVRKDSCKDGVGADGVGADSVGTEGIGAEGIGADGAGADGAVGATSQTSRCSGYPPFSGPVAVLKMHHVYG